MVLKWAFTFTTFQVSQGVSIRGWGQEHFRDPPQQQHSSHVEATHRPIWITNQTHINDRTDPENISEHNVMCLSLSDMSLLVSFDAKLESVNIGYTMFTMLKCYNDHRVLFILPFRRSDVS